MRHSPARAAARRTPVTARRGAAAWVAGALALATALALGGCSSTPAASRSAGRVAVVASTNAYGDVVRQIGGDRVAVTSIIDNPNRDPHEYQADPRDQLAISRAAVIVENGAGYDDFMTTLRHASGNDSAAVIDAARVSGYDTTQPDFNEHLWYDLPTMQKVAQHIVTALTAADPAGRAVYQRGGDRFAAKLSALEHTAAGLKAKYGGKSIAVTEPVPLYLLEACGLVDRAPRAFSKAIENGTDVAPAVMREMLALFTGHRVAALVYNEQTTGPQTTEVLKTAKAAGIPVVPVTETMPAGVDYLGWMSHNLTAIGAALEH